MNAVLDFPTLPTDAAPDVASEVVDRAQIIGGTPLVKYSATEAGLATLKADLAGKTYDLKTVKGNDAARGDRLRCVTLRTTLEKRRKEFKAPALAYGKLIDTEAARITAEIEALEQPIDEQIRADEARREAARVEAARIEAARKERHRTNLDLIRSYLLRAQEPGMTAARLMAGIEFLASQSYPAAEWEEFEAQALAAQIETLQCMHKIHAQLVAREAEAARQEAIRAENERVARELAAERLRIAEEAAAIRRQHEAQAAELKRQADELAAQRAEADRVEREAEARRQARVEAEAREALQRERDAFIAANPPTPLQQTADDAVPAFDLVATPEADRGPAGTPDGHLAQDLSRDLSQSLAGKPDAMLHAREAAAAIKSATPKPLNGLQALAAEARASRFPSEPKMAKAWWARFYALADDVSLHSNPLAT